MYFVIAPSSHLWPIKALYVSSLHSHTHTFTPGDGRYLHLRKNQPIRSDEAASGSVPGPQARQQGHEMEPPRSDHFNTRELLMPPEKHQFIVLRRLFLSKIRPPALCLRFCLFFKDTSASLAPSLTFYESIKRVSRALRWSIIPSRLFYTAASLWGSYTSCSWEEMAASLLFL